MDSTPRHALESRDTATAVMADRGHSRHAERLTSRLDRQGEGMSTDYLPPTVAAPAARDVLSSPCSGGPLGSFDEAARPLGAKTAALQLRRQRNAVMRPAAKTATEQPLGQSFLYGNGTVTFVLHTSSNGLFVERTQRQAVGTRLVQSMVFADKTAFDRWCDSEPLRFEDPVLYDQLRRRAHDALGAKR